MKKKALLWILTGVLCAGVCVALVLALTGEKTPGQDSPTLPKQTTLSKAPGQEEIPNAGMLAPPDALDSSVEIPVQATGLQLPCQIPGYGLVIEKIAPYTGTFVEDGTNAQVQDVAMLMVLNNGDYPIAYTQIRIDFGAQSLVFDISALPVGERLVVQEKAGKPLPAGKATAAAATVVQQAELSMSAQVKVTDNGDNTLTITNLTGQTIPTVRVFYKYYQAADGMYIGGIAFTVRIPNLGAGQSVTVQPSHFESSASAVVMVTTYDSEV